MSKEIYCFVTYTIDPAKYLDFLDYMKQAVEIAERLGATCLGHYRPFDNTSDEFYGSYCFPSWRSYRHFQDMVTDDPDCVKLCQWSRELDLIKGRDQKICKEF